MGPYIFVSDGSPSGKEQLHVRGPILVVLVDADVQRRVAMDLGGREREAGKKGDRVSSAVREQGREEARVEVVGEWAAWRS